MKRCAFAFFIAILVVGAGLRFIGASRSVGGSPEAIAAWAEALLSAEAARPRGPGDQESRDSPEWKAFWAVEKLKDVAALKAAAYAVEARDREWWRLISATDGKHEDELPDSYWGDVLGETKCAVRYRLAMNGSAEAAEALVALFADPALRYDGWGALQMQAALCVCGRPALPFLRRIVDGPHAGWAREIEGLIERGERGY